MLPISCVVFMAIDVKGISEGPLLRGGIWAQAGAGSVVRQPHPKEARMHGYCCMGPFHT